MKSFIKDFFSKGDQIHRTRYKLMFPSVPISNNFASFLLEKRYALIYQILVSNFF